MIEQVIPKEEIENIVSFLETVELFKKLKKSFLRELVSSMSKVYLEGGETLIVQGEIDKVMYIVLEGRLRAYHAPTTKTATQPILHGEMTNGEIIGEISLLSNEPRVDTVIAVRDSVILKLKQDAFHFIEQYEPQGALEIARIAIRRLIGKNPYKKISERCLALAIAPAGDSNHGELVRILYEELNKIKPAALITKEMCNTHFGYNIAQSSIEEYSSAQITSWLFSLENEYGYLIYETDRQMTPWTQRCFRQADKILLVAEESIYPAFNSIEINLFSDKRKYIPAIDLVFLHESNKIIGSHKWLKDRPVNNYHHLRIPSEKDTAKLIRYLNGESIGLVLNGGGARGIAHIGALKALEELNIPIDFIVGNSMGTMIAGLYAQGIPYSEIKKRTAKYIAQYRREFTLPMVSLMTGKCLTDISKDIGKEILIEDLPLRFVALSTNVTEATLNVIDKGLLWFAIRVSISIPGLFPPIYDAQGNMLVDGGILNNMPVDVLREYMGEGKILAINCHPHIGEEQNRRLIPDTWFSGWKLFFERLNPFHKKKNEPDNIMDIILSSMHLAAITHEKTMEKEADYLLKFDTSKYDLLDFNLGEELIELGYRASMQKLPEMFKK